MRQRDVETVVLKPGHPTDRPLCESVGYHFREPITRRIAMRKGITGAVIKSIGGILLGFVQLSTPNHGIIKPDGAQAIGFDIWGVGLYALCIWLVISGVRFFQSGQEQT